MIRNCIKCESSKLACSSYGFFTRKSDNRRLRRFRCSNCGFVFSQATFQRCYRQKKRRLNPRIMELLCSGVSQRRIARLLKINRKTVVRKFRFLANEVRAFNDKKFKTAPDVAHLQFDDLETFEHTKCKPLSVTLAVEKESRKILGFEVSQMPAKGHLARVSYNKYGFRKDHRPEAREKLFTRLSQKVSPKGAIIESDQNPHYIGDVKKFFPTSEHISHLGKRGSIVGQGELKKVRFDPLFSLNHTFAMLRANINRLFRKTWCTTKLPERLRDHIDLYCYYHNEIILKNA